MFRESIDTIQDADVELHVTPPPTKICQHCAAKRYPLESAGFCCSQGKVALAPLPELPAPLLQRLTLDAEFKKHARSINQGLAFTSLGSTRVVQHAGGPPSFTVSGQLHHTIGGQIGGQQPGAATYHQLYFYDAATQVARRTQLFPSVPASAMQFATDLINAENPYVALYKQAAQLVQQRPSLTLAFKTAGVDQKTYGAPTTEHEIGVIFDDDDDSIASKRDVVLTRIDNTLTKISELAQAYDPLAYPLILPYGSPGWNLALSKSDGKRMSMLDYYCYRLQMRVGTTNPLLCGGRVFQQYIVDQWTKIEQNNLSYLKNNQSKLRVETRKNVEAAAADGADAPTTGKPYRLPSSFVGSKRYMSQQYQDAMAIVRALGKPDLFITFTCNPSWPEIARELLPGQTPPDRPDIVSRVFKDKMRALEDDLFKKHVLGRVKGHVYTIEFQKR